MGDSSEDEVDVDQLLEEITIDSVKGQWEHSLGASIKVLGSQAHFDGGSIYELQQEGNTVTIDGWKAVVGKSTANRVVWSKDGELSHWNFEGELAQEGKADDEGIDETNIVKGKRRRTQVDYKELMKAEKERLLKKKKLEGGASSGNYFEDGLDDDSEDDDSDEEPPPPKAAPVTLEDVKDVNKALTAGEAMLPAAEVLPLLSKLARFDMSLEALKETKVGVAINKYRKHESEDVKTRALFLVKKWKALLSK